MPEDDRKEKVIHTRVSEALDEEIRERAANLGVSVSNLVRNVLQNAFGLVEDVVADAASIARFARGEVAASSAERAARGAQPGRVLGWQEAVLQVNALCEACNAILPRGAKAAIALVDGSGARPIRCLACMEEATRGES